MASCCLILLSLFVPSHPIYAQISSSEELTQVQSERRILWEFDTKIGEVEVQMHATPLQRPETAETTGVISHKGHTPPRHHHRHFQNVSSLLSPNIEFNFDTLLV